MTARKTTGKIRGRGGKGGWQPVQHPDILAAIEAANVPSTLRTGEKPGDGR